MVGEAKREEDCEEGRGQLRQRRRHWDMINFAQVMN